MPNDFLDTRAIRNVQSKPDLMAVLDVLSPQDKRVEDVRAENAIAGLQPKSGKMSGEQLERYVKLLEQDRRNLQPVTYDKNGPFHEGSSIKPNPPAVKADQAELMPLLELLMMLKTKNVGKQLAIGNAAGFGISKFNEKLLPHIQKFIKNNPNTLFGGLDPLPSGQKRP